MLKGLIVSLLLLPYYQKHLERAKNVCNYVTYTEKIVLVYFSKKFSKNQFNLIWCNCCCCHFNK